MVSEASVHLHAVVTNAMQSLAMTSAERTIYWMRFFSVVTRVIRASGVAAAVVVGLPLLPPRAVVDRQMSVSTRTVSRYVQRGKERKALPV